MAKKIIIINILLSIIANILYEWMKFMFVYILF